MIQAVNSEIAKQSRHPPKLVHGHTEWRTDYLGKRVKQIENSPQAYIADIDSNGSIPPHFHQVDQFQVLVAGSGSLGRTVAPLIALHYVDHHTAYGPINAGPCGLSVFTVRAQSDPGGIFLHKPGYKDFLKPTKKRYLLADNIRLSTEPVLQSRSEVALENVLEDVDNSDGLGAFMLRLGADMETTGPDPKATGGQYYLLLNGSLQLDGASYPTSSTVYAAPTDEALKVRAGPHGLEALILNFPRRES
jgi:hypothetical protein